MWWSMKVSYYNFFECAVSYFLDLKLFAYYNQWGTMRKLNNEAQEQFVKFGVHFDSTSM